MGKDKEVLKSFSALNKKPAHYDCMFFSHARIFVIVLLVWL